MGQHHFHGAHPRPNPIGYTTTNTPICTKRHPWRAHTERPLRACTTSRQTFVPRGLLATSMKTPAQCSWFSRASSTFTNFFPISHFDGRIPQRGLQNTHIQLTFGPSPTSGTPPPHPPLRGPRRGRRPQRNLAASNFRGAPLRAPAGSRRPAACRAQAHRQSHLHFR